MKSIKPGRGPSRQAAAGSAFGILFGIFWTIAAASIAWSASGAFGFIGLVFPLFGLVFIGISVYNLMYHSSNAHAEPEDRDSLLEIVESEEGTEGSKEDEAEAPSSDARFCPFCGASLSDGFSFCPKCGKKLP